MDYKAKVLEVIPTAVVWFRDDPHSLQNRRRGVKPIEIRQTIQKKKGIPGEGCCGEGCTEEEAWEDAWRLILDDVAFGNEINY